MADHDDVDMTEQSISAITIELLANNWFVADLTLDNWLVTDLNLDVMKHHGTSYAALQQFGVKIQEMDAFQLLHNPELTQSAQPALIIMSNVCPPTAYKDYLGQLIRSYAGFDASAGYRRQYYSAICYESVLGQVEGATVVSISRLSDGMIMGKTPSLVAPMVELPEYRPKACNHPPDAPLHVIQGGRELQVRVNVGGVLDPRNFLNNEGKFDIVSVCASATALGFKLVFLAEWDGGLSHCCAKGVLRCHANGLIPCMDVKMWMKITPRALAGWTGGYRECVEYAKDQRREQVLASLAEFLQKNGLPAIPPTWPSRDELEAHASLNAAAMWFWAQVVEEILDAGTPPSSTTVPG